MARRAPAPAMTDALLPSPLRGWPVVLRRGPGGAPADADADAALARIRAERLFWPAPRARAARVRVLALGSGWLAAARALFCDADIAVADDPADVDPERLERVFGPPGAVLDWARMGGLGDDDAPAATLLAGAIGVSPWDGAPLGLSDAIEAQATLRRAAVAARGPVTLIGMTAWKRRCLRPFLIGPDGPPRRARTWRGAVGAPVAVWGAAQAAPPGALRVEDGFLRSVGLGLRHTPPLSLVIGAGAPHFDATRRNAFEETVAAARFDAALLARAARLRARLLALRLTKYNLPDSETPPDAGGREAVLVPGQVATDASIRLGATAVRDDLALLAKTRARFPHAFLLYKPHPDTLVGLRRGAASAREALALADAIVTRASAADCLDWADRVATITSLTGFEALLRGRAATVFGRPFYAGWGLTDDVDPPPRDRRLTLDELTAAALILYPRYVDPVSGLPATPEAALEALARQRDGRDRPLARLTRLWRDGVSWTLNRL